MPQIESPTPQGNPPPLSTHALETTETAAGPGMGLRIISYLDLAIVVIALPVFAAAGLPILGWGATSAAWVLQRGIQAFAVRRALASGDRRAAVGVLAGSLFSRLWLVCLSVLGAGLIERKAGLAAGILAATLFTVYFCTLLMTKPFEEAGR